MTNAEVRTRQNITKETQKTNAAPIAVRETTKNELRSSKQYARQVSGITAATTTGPKPNSTSNLAVWRLLQRAYTIVYLTGGIASLLGCCHEKPRLR